MQYKNEIIAYFKKIESKKVTKKLLNERRNSKLILGYLVFMFAMWMFFLLYNISSGVTYPNSTGVLLFSFIILFILLNIHKNSKFEEMSIYNQLFYLSYLMNYQVNINLFTSPQKYKTAMESILRRYIITLSSCIEASRKVNVFNITMDEVFVIELRRIMKEKYKNFILIDNVDSIKEVIKYLLQIHYILNPDANLELSIVNYDKILDEISVFPEEIYGNLPYDDDSSYASGWFDRLNKYRDFFIAAGVSASIIIFYYLISPSIDIGMLITIGITTFFGSITLLKPKK